MGEVILDGIGSNYPMKVTNTNAALVTGSIAITNASLDVTVNVQDFVSVTQSGAYIVNLGSVAVTNNIPITGSVAITNTGSVIQATNPWIVLGSQAITNVITGSVVQSTNPWVMLGSVDITNTSGNCVRVSERYIDGKPRTSDMPYLYDVAEGNISSHTPWSKNGYNSNVGTSEEDLWSFGGLNNWILTPGSILFKSTNAADTSNGVGVQQVYINYLDGNYVQKTEVITLNGTTDVWSAGSDIYRVNNFRARRVGASGVCIGSLYCGSPVTYSFIAPGFTRARNCQYTVPSGMNLFVTSAGFSATGGKDVRMYNRATYDNGIGSFIGPAGSPGGFFMPYTEVVLNDSTYHKDFETPTKLPAKTDIKVTGISVQGGAICYVALRGWLEDINHP